jgi:hypothetical protein
MKKTLSIIIVLLFACHCFGQEKEQQKKPFTYSAGVAYNQIWLQGNCYGTDEYGIVSSSPYNWGLTSYFSMYKGRHMLFSGINYSSCCRIKERSSAYYERDKWQEASLAFAAGFRVTDEHLWINVTPFLGFDFSYLINYEKDMTMGSGIKHFNTDELCARRNHNYSVGNEIPIPFGISLLGGIGIACPIAKHFEIGLSYGIKFKIINDIRNTTLARVESITSPILYHNASIGVSYRFN